MLTSLASKYLQSPLMLLTTLILTHHNNGSYMLISPQCAGVMHHHTSFISQCCLMGMTDKWRIEGDYFEACNCDTVCACMFMGNPDQGQCDLTSAWRIQNGHYENTWFDWRNCWCALCANKV